MSKYQLLRRLLTRIRYAAPFSAELLLSSAPPSLTLPILSHLFLSFSPLLTSHFLQRGFLLSSSSFSLSALYALLLSCFQYRPQLSQRQFASEKGFVDKKLSTLTDVVQLCLSKHEELLREAGRRDEAHSGEHTARVGLPRVATLKQGGDRAGRDSRDDGDRAVKERREVQRKEQYKPARRQQEPQQEERKEAWMAEGKSGRGAAEEAEEAAVQPQHVSFNEEDGPLAVSSLSFSSPRAAASSQFVTPSSLLPAASASVSPPQPHHETLSSLHQQLHHIAHRTQQLHQDAESRTPPRTAAAAGGGMQEVTRRLQALESMLKQDIGGIREAMGRMEQRLAALELAQEGRKREDGSAEEVSETREEKVREEETSVAAKAEVKAEEDRARSRVVVPTDTSAFLGHMQARLAATASLIDNARRQRRGGGGGGAAASTAEETAAQHSASAR